MGKIIKNENKRYLPYSPENARDNLEKSIHSMVTFRRKTVFTVSGSTIMISISNSSFENAKNLFWQYIGKKNCYDILKYEDYMVILLVGEKEKLKLLRDEIKRIVKDAPLYEDAKKSNP